MAMTSTPYFDAYERGERSVSYIVAKYDTSHRFTRGERTITNRGPGYSGSIFYERGFIYCPYIPLDL